MFINKKEGECKINFDGVPFSVDEEKVLDCQYGCHYYKEKEQNKRQRFQGTKKVGCQAKVKITKFSTYPEFKLTKEDTKGKSQQEIQQLQKVHLEDLKSALKQETPAIQGVPKYWVSIPSIEAHSGHPVGDKAMYSQRIHPLLVAKITETVLEGITNTAEVKRSLRFYANTILAKFNQVGKFHSNLIKFC